MFCRSEKPVGERLESAVKHDRLKKAIKLMALMDNEHYLFDIYLRYAIKKDSKRVFDHILNDPKLEAIRIDTLKVAVKLIKDPNDKNEYIYKLLASPKCNLKETFADEPYGNTILCQASKVGYTPLIDKLLELGVDPSYDKDKALMDSMHVVKDTGSIGTTIKLLGDNRVSPGSRE